MIFRKYIIVVFILIGVVTNLKAQRLKDWIDLGDHAMQDNDPYGALEYYSEAMKLDSAKGEVNYKFAEALRQNQAYAKAAYYYYKVYRRDYGKVYPEGGAWLATMQKQSGQYDKAKQTWRRVRNQFAGDKTGYWYRKAIEEMRACDLAKEWMIEASPFEMEKIEGSVNSNASEFGGVFTDKDELIFTSLRGEFDAKGRLTSDPNSYLPQLYVADSSFTEVKILPLPSPEKQAFNYSISALGNRIAFATKVANDQYKILIYESGKSSPERIIPEANDTSWYSQPAFGYFGDREVVYFASDRPDGFGQEDIWFIFLDQPDDGPANAGDNINTPGSEITPFYREDTQKLYFASDWHYGFGGYDLFSSDEIGGSFSFPENLQKPFNSPANDMYYSFNAPTGKGTTTSNRIGSTNAKGSGCCNDLWLFTEEKQAKKDSLPEIESLEALNDYLPVKLYFHNDEPNPRTRAETTDLDYLETYRAYIKLLPLYETAYREGLSQDEGDKAEEDMDAFFRDSVDEGVDHLKLFSRLLAQELDEGQEIAITVKGFASPLAKTDYNVKLTSRRISSLENYLSDFDRGTLIPYLDNTAENGGRLEIIKIPFGEYTASNIVSDNPNEANAIYSVAAAQERKIEIVSVQRASSDTTLSEMRFETEILDFGTIENTDTLSFEFSYKTTGLLKIDSIGYDTTVVAIDNNLTGKIIGKLHPFKSTGKQNTVITIYGNFPEGKKELNLTFEITKKP